MCFYFSKNKSSKPITTNISHICKDSNPKINESNVLPNVIVVNRLDINTNISQINEPEKSSILEMPVEILEIKINNINKLPPLPDSDSE